MKKKLILVSGLIGALIGYLISIAFSEKIENETIIARDYIHSYGVSIDSKIKFYIEAIAIVESDGNYKARRPNSQYLGKYQIGNAARKDIGLSGLNTEEGYNRFLSLPELQDVAMIMYLKYNINQLKGYLNEFDNRKVGQYYVTKSGLLAMAHACGSDGVIRFIKSNGTYVPVDGNNKKATDYLQFNNFNLNLYEN